MELSLALPGLYLLLVLSETLGSRLRGPGHTSPSREGVDGAQQLELHSYNFV